MPAESEARRVGRDSTDVHVARFFDSVHAPSRGGGRRVATARRALIWLNESIRKSRPVEWDSAAGGMKKG